jgi:hypothetical protein
MADLPYLASSPQSLVQLPGLCNLLHDKHDIGRKPIAPAKLDSAVFRAVPSGYDDFPISSPEKAVFVYRNYSYQLFGILRIRPQNFIPPHYITCGSVVMEWQWHTYF